MSAHTPAPWTISDHSNTDIADAKGDPVGETFSRYWDGHTDHFDAERRANAAHIVRCVNAHDELVAALQAADDRLDRMMCPLKVQQQIKAALAKASA